MNLGLVLQKEGWRVRQAERIYPSAFPWNKVFSPYPEGMERVSKGKVRFIWLDVSLSSLKNGLTHRARMDLDYGCPDVAAIDDSQSNLFDVPV